MLSNCLCAIYNTIANSVVEPKISLKNDVNFCFLTALYPTIKPYYKLIRFKIINYKYIVKYGNNDNLKRKLLCFNYTLISYN